ncbi:hypothetical protein [Metabacillus rhizolycopersici]|uniref:Transcriptional regulator n=1 Tax=Metabacillus rhizolycopersici TaxID=2875709 RepID=A0ABS7UVW8_9BACI|nr:hypothetical protein [Metabacillus rhizolycopersici]MBZ5752453.1 hypothetical protein [Metabacillus rhizolycopersici]
MFDDILTVLSVIGSIKLEKFREVYDTLLKHRFNEDEQQRLLYSHNDVLRDLEALGHCEVDYSNRKIYICPPSFALLPSRGLPRIVLAGGRSEKMLKRLMKLVNKNSDKVSVILSDHLSVKNPLFPQTICIEAKSIGILKQVTERIGIEGNLEIPASWCLSIASPSVNDISKSLVYSELVEPNWKKAVFCYERLYFRQFECSDEIKLVKYKNPISQQQYTWIWNGNAAATIDRGWGRYVILNNHKSRMLLFDQVKQRFAIPSTMPLPKQLARAATLCTGFLPRKKAIRKQIGYLPRETNITVYEGVTEFIALEISKKLGLDLLETNL